MTDPQTLGPLTERQLADEVRTIRLHIGTNAVERASQRIADSHELLRAEVARLEATIVTHDAAHQMGKGVLATRVAELEADRARLTTALGTYREWMYERYCEEDSGTSTWVALAHSLDWFDALFAPKSPAEAAQMIAADVATGTFTPQHAATEQALAEQVNREDP